MKKGFLALTLLGLLALLPTAALADTCSGGELSLTDNSGNVEACLSVSGNTVTLTHFYFNGVDTAGKVFTIDWNTDAALTGDTDAIGGPWAEDNGNPNGFADGWKSFFSDVHQANVGSSSSPNFPPSFSWTFDDNPGTDFALHIGGFDQQTGCSVWVSTFAGPDSNKFNTCSGGEVPEPASLTLLGTGLVGLGGVLRRKLRKKA